MFELEVKASASGAEYVVNQLHALGTEFTSPPRVQADSIFGRSAEDILHPGEGTTVLRIRVEDGGSVLNVKKHRSSELDCIEHEVAIADGEAMTNILTTLGYIQVVQVNKTRQSTTFDRFTICLDQVDTLGTFVEVELLTNSPPTKDDSELLETTIRNLSDGDILTKGYDRMLLEAKDS
jgi:adenylate cyclase class 2